MRKFISGLFFSLVFIVVLIMLFSVPKNSFFRDKAGAYWSGGSTITFEDIDYSVNLPYGNSLNDISNNQFVADTGFSSVPDDYTFSLYGNKLSDYWSFRANNISGSGVSMTRLTPTGVKVFNNGVSSYNYFYSKPIPFSPNTSYFVYVSYDNAIYTGSLVTPSALDGTYGTFSFTFDQPRPTYMICRLEKSSNDFNNIYLNVGNRSGADFSVEFISLTTKPYYTNYSNLFLNQLLEAEDIYNSSYNWSTSPVMSVSYDFNTFTPDTTLYYIKDISVFNISKTLPNYLSELSSKTTFTEDILSRLKNAYSSLKSSPPNSSKLDLSSRFSNTLISAIGEIVSSIGRILYYSSQVATYSGLLVFTPILDMFSYLSIILYSSFNSWFTL